METEQKTYNTKLVGQSHAFRLGIVIFLSNYQPLVDIKKIKLELMQRYRRDSSISASDEIGDDGGEAPAAMTTEGVATCRGRTIGTGVTSG
jgi:hypothetical protein